MGPMRPSRRQAAWMEAIANASYRASALLAKEKGAFPLYDAAAYAGAPMVRRLSPEVQALIAEHGLRNALLTSIAPTGTISLFRRGTSALGSSRSSPIPTPARCCSPTAPGPRKRSWIFAVAAWRDLKGDAPLPEHFVTAQTLCTHGSCPDAGRGPSRGSTARSPRRSTCPPTFSFEDFKDVYAEAYATGCKGPARPTAPMT